MPAVDVVVLGALHLDVVVDAPALPRLDETLIGEDVHYVAGGKGGNQAVAAARHGATVCMAGRVGADDFGNRLLAHLREAGVDHAAVGVSAARASGMSVAIVDAAGEYGAVVVSAANRELAADSVELPGRFACLLLQNEIPAAANLAAARRARRAGARVVLNAAPWRDLDAELLRRVDLLIVNRLEAAMATSRAIDNAADAADAAIELADGRREAIVTLGADGAVYCAADGTTVHHAPFPVTAVSSHGAGDVFVGALLARRARAEDMHGAIRYAAAAAALHVATAVAERHTVVTAKVDQWLRDREA